MSSSDGTTQPVSEPGDRPPRPPRGSQLGAFAQPTVVHGRIALDDALAATTRRFADDEQIPRPPYRGGRRTLSWQVSRLDP